MGSRPDQGRTGPGKLPESGSQTAEGATTAGAVSVPAGRVECVSVGAAGTGRWVHSGVWRYGELAGMSWQRSVPPMCSRRVKITMAGRKAIAAAVVSRTVLQASCIENRHRWGVVSGEAVAASLFVWPARQSACKRPRRSGAKSAQSTAVHLTKPWGRWTARSMTQVSCRIRPRCRPFCVWAVEKAPPTATQAGPSQ